MGDLALFNNKIAGDILVEFGQPKIDDGLETAVFISLFSGKTRDYWGNELEESRPSYRYGGEFEALMVGLALTTSSALRLEEAAKRDLNWLIVENIASSISTESAIANNTYFITIKITEPNGNLQNLKYSINWTEQFNNPVSEK